MNIDKKLFSAKTLSLSVNDIDEKTRKVVGYLSAFDIMDSDRDIILKGSFAKSIQERGPASLSNRKIAYLWSHDWNEPIGKFTELVEDSYGLKFVAQLGRSVKGQDCFLNYQDGILREHSIGFYYLEDGYRQINDSKIGYYTEISDLELFEGSAVTFGANQFTPVMEVNKSEDIQDALSDLNSRMDTYIYAIKNSSGSDDRFYELEMNLTTLKSAYNELFTKSKGVIIPKVEIEIPKENKISPFKKIMGKYF